MFTKKNSNGFIGLGLMVTLILVLGGAVGGYYFLEKSNKTTVDDTTELENSVIVSDNTSSTEASPVTTNTQTKIDENIKTPSLTGKISVDSSIKTTENCDTATCFEEKFSKCEKSTKTMEINSAFGKNVYQYTIISSSNEGCVMTTKYLESVEPSWENKEMTCTYDNKLSVEKSSEKLYGEISNGTAKCSGALFTIMKDLYN